MDTIRIVRRLAALYPAETASRLKRAVIEGQVTVNGAVVDDPGALVPEKAAVVFDPNRKIRRKVDTSLTILYQDDDSVAVVKPAGLLTHPTEAKEKDSLLSRVSTWAARAGKGRAYVGIVHRLDKETSGALVFARTRKGLVSLQAQLRAHTVDRRYVAVVEGRPRGGQGDVRVVDPRGGRAAQARGPGGRDGNQGHHRLEGPGEVRDRDPRRGEAPDRPDAPDPDPLLARRAPARRRPGLPRPEEAAVPDPVQAAGAPRRTPRVGEAGRRKGLGHDAASEGLRGAPSPPFGRERRKRGTSRGRRLREPRPVAQAPAGVHIGGGRHPGNDESTPKSGRPSPGNAPRRTRGGERRCRGDERGVEP